MKGQMVFEFLIAGIIFFSVVIYSIYYLNVNVSDFSDKSYQNKLQSKAIQISEILINGKSSLGLVDEPYFFNMNKIQNFDQVYCTTTEDYRKLMEEIYLHEKTSWGVLSHDTNILLFSENNYLECGPEIPRNTHKAEIERVGLLNGNIVKLRVVVW